MAVNGIAPVKVPIVIARTDRSRLGLEIWWGIQQPPIAQGRAELLAMMKMSSGEMNANLFDSKVTARMPF